MKFLKKLWNWLKSLFKKSEIKEDPVIAEPAKEEVKLDAFTTPCMVCKYSNTCTVKNVYDHIEYIKNFDWENLTKETFDRIYSYELDCEHVSEYVNWYKISKIKGLPDDFIRKYKHKIAWDVYNKSYLKKATKEMLKAEGYIN